MTFKLLLKRALIRRCALPLVLAIWRSCQIRIEGWSHFVEGTKGPSIIALWHDRLLVMPHFLRRLATDRSYCALISHSRDGQLLQCAAASFANLSCLSIPHDRKAHVLREAAQALRLEKILLVTPDGPRGPHHKIKPGLIAIAALAGANIIPMTWSATRVWTLPTWDRMAIPLPFSKVTLRFGQPVENIVGKRGPTLESDLARVEKALRINA